MHWKIQSLHFEKLRFIGKEFIIYRLTLISVCEMPQMQQKHLRHLALFLKNSLFLPFEIFNSDENTCRQDSIQKRQNTFDKSIQKVLRLYKLACRTFFNFHFLSERNKVYVSTVIFLVVPPIHFYGQTVHIHQESWGKSLLVRRCIRHFSFFLKM